jgi:hypothetical protein
VLVCFRLLRGLEFTINQALAGALELLFGTTFLHYIQNMMENNLTMLLRFLRWFQEERQPPTLDIASLLWLTDSHLC